MTTSFGGIAVDIDETLAWTVGHWVKQMQILFGNPENLSVMDMVHKYQLTQNIPYYQTPAILHWIEEQKHCNAAQLDIPLIPDSNIILQRIHQTIPIRAYTSIRPQSILEGTKAWLQKNNFPLAELILRPYHIPHQEGNKWKASILEKRYPVITMIIDDNPKVVEYLPPSYRGTVFLYNNKPSPRQDIHVIPCKTWHDIEQEILKRDIQK